MSRLDDALPDSFVSANGLPVGEILVTGGLGFVGSHLVDALLAAGRSVHVLDDLSSGSPDNLRQWRSEPRLRISVASAEDPQVAAAACRSASCVFHLAGAVGVQLLMTDPLMVIRRNLRCTEVMLEAAAKTRIPILITSSSEVYGQGPVPFCESDPVLPGVPDELRGGYACAKAMGEWLALGYAKRQALPVVVVRLFNVVGARQSGAYGMVLPRFLLQATSGRPVTVFGDGTQTRCFAAATEVAQALIALLATRSAHGKIINVGSDREISMRALAELVCTKAASSSPIVLVPFAEMFPTGFVDPARRVPSLDRLRSVIGWVPERPIEAIVSDLLSLMRVPQAVVSRD